MSQTWNKHQKSELVERQESLMIAPEGVRRIWRHDELEKTDIIRRDIIYDFPEKLEESY